MGGTSYVPNITPFTGHANEDGILVMEVRVRIICFTYNNDKLCLKADDRSSTHF